MHRLTRIVLCLAAALGLAAAGASAQTKLLRFPDVHKDKVVFTYAGDLWVASSNGGTATRLTAHPGLELFARFSPDGQWIAFTGQYDGDEQVYVIGEMIAELNNSHAYVAGGDFKLPPRPDVALPGARFELDKAAGRYRIAKIFAGHNDEETYRSPLTEIGVDVHAGDYVLAIDGEEFAANDNPYRLLRHKADRPVRMTVNSKPTLDGSREITFRPVRSETDLIYGEWVDGNRERVTKLSNGRLGYIHLPDMGDDGFREFARQYFGQIRKQGLVVDVRENGGGSISPMLLERLARHPLSVDFARTSDDPQPYPQVTFYGPMVCLMNEGSGSDGDIFPYMFRELGLGPLIGTRTWGGVVGISFHGPMIDGGQIFVPEFASASLKGQWIIEGHGVDPDVVVENDVKSVLDGRDPQLERGVAEALKRLEAEPKAFPQRPAGPVRTHPQP